MPRMRSIARRRPTRSSRSRCSLPASGTPVRAVSVAIWRNHLSSWGHRDPPAPDRCGPPRGIAAAVAVSRRRLPCRWMAEDSPGVERLWPARLRWRMRGAWLWPAFFGLTVVDGVLITVLPPYTGTPPGIVGGLLLAGFANLFVLAVLTPFAGRLLRRRRPDLPRAIAKDYAGTTLLCLLAAVILVAGVLHRPAVADTADDEAALWASVRAYVRTHAPGFAAGLPPADPPPLAARVHRACVPGPDPRRSLCLIVDTDRRPPRVARDESMRPNGS